MGDCVVLTPSHFDAMVRLLSTTAYGPDTPCQVDFCADVGCKLVYGLSAMYGSCCVRDNDPRVMYGTGHCDDVDLRTCAWDERHCTTTGTHTCRRWDPSNAREILQHAHARGKGRWPFGFELGNELAAGAHSVSSDRSPAEMLEDFQTLAMMLDEVSPDCDAALHSLQKDTHSHWQSRGPHHNLRADLE